MFKLRRSGQCVGIAALLIVIWVVSFIAYLGKFEAQNRLSHRRAIVAADRARLSRGDRLNVVQNLAISNDDQPKVQLSSGGDKVPVQMKEEQLSLNEIPEVNLEELSVIKDVEEQVCLLMLIAK